MNDELQTREFRVDLSIRIGVDTWARFCSHRGELDSESFGALLESGELLNMGGDQLGVEVNTVVDCDE